MCQMCVHANYMPKTKAVLFVLFIKIFLTILINSGVLFTFTESYNWLPVLN